jgi:hypothetical protein
VYDDDSVIVTHGYNNRDPATLAPHPDYREDSWVLTSHSHGAQLASSQHAQEQSAHEDHEAHAVSSQAWREAAFVPGTTRPSARYGSATFRLGQDIYLFGGDDGGHKRGFGSYVWGAYFNDVWRMRKAISREGVDEWSWQEIPVSNAAAKPEPRSLHACITFPTLLPPDADEKVTGKTFSEDKWQLGTTENLYLKALESAFCFGGLVANAVEDSKHPVIDSDEAWVANVIDDDTGNSVLWTRKSFSGVLQPPPRHGHALAYFSRVVHLQGNVNEARLEHSIFMFGGSAVACDVSKAKASGLTEDFDFIVYKRGLRSAQDTMAFSSQSCQFGDTWRLVWYTQIETNGKTSVSLDFDVGRTSDFPAALADARWQHLSSSRPSVLAKARTSKSNAAWRQWVASSVLFGQDPFITLQHPSPRSMASLTPVAGGLLLFGGGVCTPGCTCYGDSWMFVISPLSTVDSFLPNASIEAARVNAAWVPLRNRRQKVAVLDRHELDGVGALARWLLRSVESNETDVTTLSIGFEEPLPRYRHAMASDYRAGLCTTLHNALGETQQTFINERCGQFHAILFGGESYMPSTYFDDTWLWVHDDALIGASTVPMSKAIEVKERLIKVVEVIETPTGLIAHLIVVMSAVFVAVCALTGSRLRRMVNRQQSSGFPPSRYGTNGKRKR